MIARDSVRIGSHQLLDHQRELQQRGGKDDRDHAGRIDLDRQVRNPVRQSVFFPAASWNTAPGYVLSASFRRIVRTKGTDDDSQDHCHGDHDAANLFSLHKLLIQAVQVARHTGNDVDKKDNGDTISDSLIGNLLTQPHNEHGAGCQAHNHLCHDQRAEVR